MVYDVYTKKKQLQHHSKIVPYFKKRMIYKKCCLLKKIKVDCKIVIKKTIHIDYNSSNLKLIQIK